MSEAVEFSHSAEPDAEDHNDGDSGHPPNIEAADDAEDEVAAAETRPEDGEDEADSEGDDEEASSSDAEPSMVVTRERRKNAGSRMPHLLAQAQDEDDETKHIYEHEDWQEAVDDEEFGEAQAAAEDEGDVALEDSESDNEDAQGAADDEDAGEKELLKKERQEKLSKKRKAQDALLGQQRRKKVKHVPGAQSSAPAPRPRKKSERVSWLPTPEEGPTRSSARSATVKNKGEIHERLKQKEKKRLSTVAMMEAAEKRKEKDKLPILTQADRLKEAARVERQNSKSLNRWEESEKTRQKEQAAKLEALKNRRMEGPSIRYYSGPAVWVDDKLKHVGKGPRIQEIFDSCKPGAVEQQPGTEPGKAPETAQLPDKDPSRAPDSVQQLPWQFLRQPAESHTEQVATPSTEQQREQPPGAISMAPASLPNDSIPPEVQSPVPVHEDSQSAPSQHPPPEQNVPQAAAAPPQQEPILLDGIYHYASLPYGASHQPPYLNHPQPMEHTFQLPAALPIPPPPKPKIAALALRNLLILQNVPNLDKENTITSRRDKDKDKDAAEKTSKKDKDREALHAALQLPPPSDTKRASHKLNKPTVELCPITRQPARYRDPLTGLFYHDAYAFKSIRRLVGGNCRWTMWKDGAFAGAVYSEPWGRPATGVPIRFLGASRAASNAPVKQESGQAQPSE